MGTRICKMLGYGLVDLVPEDPRINWKSRLFEYELEGSKVAEEYFGWLNARGQYDVAKSVLLRDEAGRISIQDSFQWGTADGGLKNVLCIRPLAWRDWYRYDDTMDYAEQTYFSKKGQRDKVKVSDSALYPHISYMDSRIGERLGKVNEHDPFAWLRAKNSDSVSDLSTLNELAVEAGFADHADALEHCVPHVPDEVRWLTEFAEVFTDQKTVLELRPMLYTWWS